MTLTRVYNSNSANLFTGLFGPNWQSKFDLKATRYTGNPAATFVQQSKAYFWRLGGQLLTFAYDSSASAWKADSDIFATATQLVDGQGAHQGWIFSPDGITRETYNAQGLLLSIENASGPYLWLTYGPDQYLSTVTDRRNRKLSVTTLAGKATSVTFPDGRVISYVYNGLSYLQSAVYPDDSVSTTDNSKVDYLYEVSGKSWLLTGLIDETAVRIASWGYDSNGRAELNTLGSPTSLISRNAFVYNADGTVTIFQPLGAQTTLSFGTAQNVKHLTGLSGLCPSCNGSQFQAATLDGATGHYDVVTDFAGTATDTDYDANGLSTQIIKAKGTPQQQTEMRSWNTTLRVPLQIDRAGQRQIYTYNTRGQALTMSMMDTASGTSRTSITTYCEQANVDAGNCPLVGLVTSIDGPRTDASDVISYTYYASDDATCASASSSCPHRKGDLWKVTNASGQVTQILSYDGAGRPMTTSDANGVVTVMEYTPRGWPSARKVLGTDNSTDVDDAITRLEYDPIGQVSKVTQPDGAYTTLDYDEAHRLTGFTDALGNNTHFTLDNAGHRIAEDTKDTNGTVKHSLSRVYDVLGQLKTLADAASTPTDFTHDLNGATDTVTDPLLRVIDSDVDPLGRLIKVIANTGGGASDKAMTQFQYDARDNLTAVIDPKGLSTRYVYDGLDDLKQLVSPDTGTTTFGYDAAGNRISQLDARGKATGFGYDALGRLTGQTVPTSAQNVYFDYDLPPSDCPAGESFGIGRLSRVRDESGSTRYCFDRRGNVVRKVQTVVGGSTLTVLAAYDISDRLRAMSYPSGAIVTYLRDGGGQIIRVDAVPTATAAQVTVVSAASYLPFGPMTTLSFGNGRVLTKAYDLNYNIDKVSDAAASNPLSADFSLNAVGAITGLIERTSATATVSRTFSYDGLDRVTGQKNGAAVVEGFSYDATGNRLSKTVGTSTLTYGYGTLDHRLNSVGSTARSYDPNGNTTAIDTSTKGKVFTFDDRNRLRDVKIANKLKASYRYNGEGERVLRTDSATTANTRQFVYDEAGRLLGEYTTTGVRIQEYVWLDDTLLAILSDHDGSTYQFVETDHLGTPRAVIHPVKNSIIWRWNLNNTSFGDHAPIADPDANRLGYTLNLRYPGQVYDSISGMNYNYFRDYDPGTGRYVESDPIGLGGGMSTYGYVDENPISFSDPFGLEVGAPGPAESFIPVWGSGRQAINDFQTGHPVWGTVNGALAVSDVFLVKAAVTGVCKGGWKLGSHTWKHTRAWYGRRSSLAKGTPVHHWLIERNSPVGKALPDWLVNQPWNLLPMKSRAFHDSVHGWGKNAFNDAERAWHGMPVWMKVLLADSYGKTANEIRSEDCECSN